jgi:hypothetical protein
VNRKRTKRFGAVDVLKLLDGHARILP